MQHRQPRLGDILDDYCPRERRLTNHAVVAMVGADIKQTRCTTCEAEHEYKHAKVPATRKKKDAPAALYKQVLADAQPENVRVAEAAESDQPAEQAAPAAESQPQAAAEATPEPDEAATAEAPEQPESEPEEEEGPVHRRLIRATLPRPEGPVQRPAPQFTVRQPGKFGGNARGGGRPQGGMGSMTRPRTSSSRGSFGRNGTRETFNARPSGGSHHAHQRSRPGGHGPAGRPMRHGKKPR